MECILVAGHFFLVAVDSPHAGVFLDGFQTQLARRVDQTEITVEERDDTHVIRLTGQNGTDVVRLAKFSTFGDGDISEWFGFSVPELLRSCE